MKKQKIVSIIIMFILSFSLIGCSAKKELSENDEIGKQADVSNQSKKDVQEKNAKKEIIEQQLEIIESQDEIIATQDKMIENQEEIIETQEEIIVKQEKIIDPTIAEETNLEELIEVSYMEADINEMIPLLDTDLQKAKEKYEFQNISLSGKIKYLVDGEMGIECIGLQDDNESIDFVYGFSTDKELKDFFATLTEGDRINIKGNVFSVDSHYYINLDSASR